jgi:hypothetical protein
MDYHITLNEEQLQILKWALDHAVRAPERDPSQMELRLAAEEFQKWNKPVYANIGPKDVRKAIGLGIPTRLEIGSVYNSSEVEFCYRVSLLWTDSVGVQWQYDPSFPIQGKTIEEWEKRLFKRLRYYRMNATAAKSLASEGVELMLEFRTKRMAIDQKKDLVRWFRGQGEIPESAKKIIKPIYEEKKALAAPKRMKKVA